MAIHIRRRDFIVTLGSAAAAFPLAARAQAPDIPVVGFLHAGHERPRAVASFQKGLAEGGYVADRNVAVIAAFGNAAASTGGSRPTPSTPDPPGVRSTGASRESPIVASVAAKRGEFRLESPGAGVACRYGQIHRGVETGPGDRRADRIFQTITIAAPGFDIV